MASTKNYHLGLLYLIHLMISADGVIDEREFASLIRIRKDEKIPDNLFKEFEEGVRVKSEREIFKTGIKLIGECSINQKLKAFVHLYNMAAVDGSVHEREVRLLLYSVKRAGIEYADVVKAAKTQNVKTE
jgi:uncharacterized tellurite resistance protein B-like protein